MNELGQTIIENYNTFAPKNMFSEWLKNLLQPLATLSLGFFVYKYTDNRHKKRLLNELDSKSEWRKTLFIIGGNSTVTLDDVHCALSVHFLCTQKQKAHNHMGCRLYNGDGGIRTRVQRS